MKTIAITGATGFIGRRLAQYLASEDTQIIAFGRRREAHPQGADRYISWDISKGPLTLNGMPEIDVVIHCAGSVTDWGRFADMFNVNVTGTKNVLNTFQKARQFIHISSASVYDPGKSKLAIREDAPYPQKYLNAYGHTKMLAEIAVKESTNLNRVIVRPHIVYGPEDKTIFPRLMKASRFGRLPLIGTGENLLSLTYLDNLCEAISLIQQKEFTCEVFNITDEGTDTLNNIVAALIETLELDERIVHLDKNLAGIAGKCLETTYNFLKIKIPPPITPYIISQMATDYTLDISKAQELLAYRPLYDYKKGFEEIKKWRKAKKKLN